MIVAKRLNLGTLKSTSGQQGAPCQFARIQTPTVRTTCEMKSLQCRFIEAKLPVHQESCPCPAHNFPAGMFQWAPCAETVSQGRKLARKTEGPNICFFSKPCWIILRFGTARGEGQCVTPAVQWIRIKLSSLRPADLRFY